LARTLDLKRNQIEVGLRNLEGNRNIYQNNLLEVENAKEREAEQKLRADAGQVNPQTLIDAQNDLIRAENALVTTLVNVLRDRLQLRLDVGVIETSSENFWLQAQILAENATEPAAKELQPDVSGELIPPEELFK
jgi:outer membrane protein TolC